MALAPASTTARRAAFSPSTAARGSLPATAEVLVLATFQALLSPRTVGASIATRTVAVERSRIGSPAPLLLSVSARGIALRLIRVADPILHLRVATSLLVESRFVSSAGLLVESWLISTTSLLVDSLIGSASLCLVDLLLRTRIAELRLIVFLIELGLGEVGVAGVGVEIVRAIVVHVRTIDIRVVDIGPVNVCVVDVVTVVVIVAVNERIRI